MFQMKAMRASQNSRHQRVVSGFQPYNAQNRSFVQSGTNKVYVGNLSWDVSWQDLKDHMKLAGKVNRADVLMEEATGRSKGCGLVEFETADQARNAIQRLNGTELKGRVIFVREDKEATKPPPPKLSYVEKSITTTPQVGIQNSTYYSIILNSVVKVAKLGVSNFVYVGNLSWDVSWQHLKDHFRLAGNVIKADVLKDPATGKSKGCGIVQYETIQEANNAIVQLHNTELLGRVIFVREDRDRDEVGHKIEPPPPHGDSLQVPRNTGSSNGCRLYVGNLAFNVRWQDLKDHFKQVVPVVRADVMMEDGQTNRSKGYGIVELQTPEEALLAMTTLNNTMINDRPIFIREDREERRG